MKPVTRLAAPSSNDERDATSDALQWLISVVLTYHYSTEQPLALTSLPGAAESLDLLGWTPTEFTSRLRRDFFTHLYVRDRDKERALRKLFRSPGVAGLVGPRGSGKSTLILEAVAALRKRERSGDTSVPRVEYLDVQANWAALQATSPDSYDLCLLVYQRLFRKYIWDSDLNDDYELSLVREDETGVFDGARRAVRSAQCGFEELLPGGRLRGAFDESYALYEGRPGMHRLRTLLGFLRRNNIEIFLVVDNLDQRSSEFQLNVARHLAYLNSNGLSGAVVAMRPSAHLYLQSALDGVAFVQTLRVSEEAGSAGRVNAVLSKRLKYVDLLWQESPIQDGRGHTRAQQLLRLLGGLGATPYASDFYGVLLSWNNDSVRGTTLAIADFLDDIARRESVLLRVSNSDLLVARIRKNDSSEGAGMMRAGRSIALRYAILGGERYSREISAPLVYNRYAGRTRRLPRMSLVNALYLIYRGGELEIPEDEFVDRMIDSGEDEDALGGAISALARSRGIDEVGLIERSSPLGDRGRRLLRLTRAGEFMWERAIVASEYLFWSAMYHPDGDACFPQGVLERRTGLSPRDIENDVLRLQVGVDFVDRYILPDIDQRLLGGARTALCGNLRYSLERYWDGGLNEMASDDVRHLVTGTLSDLVRESIDHGR